MTPAKKKALEMLLVRGRATTKNTTEHYISGRVAACLEREGLAVWRDGLHEITDAGREALARESGAV